MNLSSNLKVKLEIESVWMTIANDKLSVADAVKKLERLGNVVTEIDEQGRRIKVQHN
jgi:hypothetical protein